MPTKTKEPQSSAPDDTNGVGDDLVQAALRAARNLGKDVADVPVIAIAREAGVSRSTLIRRLGGSRASLDAAVRAAGVDPGGQAPVRTRALDAAATLIDKSGLASATLEAIAAATPCSVHSLYAVFGGRDELLRALFERHSPLLQIEDFFDGDHGDLPASVRSLYDLIAHTLDREPRVAPALLAEALARPDSPAIRNLLGHNAPRLLASLGAWLTNEMQSGRIREIPLPLLIQQLLAPVVIHMLLRPAANYVPGIELPDLDATCATFADNFLRAVATQPPN
ncbi:TetR/AcrR family transcriptional regulator [Mycobacterium sp. HNNTM2301]|uniref:TetR/AcrR family transcriptional regulator n=1 Tax=Mycobacterium hainanense TaxID=3289775 RepID=UPI0035A68926